MDQQQASAELEHALMGLHALIQETRDQLIALWNPVTEEQRRKQQQELLDSFDSLGRNSTAVLFDLSEAHVDSEALTPASDCLHRTKGLAPHCVVQ